MFTLLQYQETTPIPEPSLFVTESVTMDKWFLGLPESPHLKLLAPPGDGVTILEPWQITDKIPITSWGSQNVDLEPRLLGTHYIESATEAPIYPYILDPSSLSLVHPQMAEVPQSLLGLWTIRSDTLDAPTEELVHVPIDRWFPEYVDNARVELLGLHLLIDTYCTPLIEQTLYQSVDMSQWYISPVEATLAMLHLPPEGIVTVWPYTPTDVTVEPTSETDDEVYRRMTGTEETYRRTAAQEDQ